MEISRRHEARERLVFTTEHGEYVTSAFDFKTAIDENAVAKAIQDAAKAEQDAELQRAMGGMTRNERRVFIKRMKRAGKRK